MPAEEAEATQPVKRVTRRKPAAQLDAWKGVETDELDQERIGTQLDDHNVLGITFPDAREYRCEAGKIIERVR